jgi:hypothetical protein
MASFIARPGILTFSLALDVAWMVTIIGGFWAGRTKVTREKFGAGFWPVLALTGVAMVQRLWQLRAPPAYLRQPYLAPAFILFTTWFVGLMLGILTRREPEEPPLWR